MKTVALKNNGTDSDEISLAIPVTIQFYLTKSRFVAILADLAFHGEITFPLTKVQMIEAAKKHLKRKGYSAYPDYYEDTEDIPMWNNCHSMASKVVESKFPELNNKNH